MEIYITARSTSETLYQLRDKLGGELTERWGEHLLTIDNDKAKGTIRSITFDWGVNFREYNIIFYEDITITTDNSLYNPIHFSYCLEGFCEHWFDVEGSRRRLEQFQSSIVTSASGTCNHIYFPKNIKLKLNGIQIVREQFLQKKLSNVALLNQNLYQVFSDKNHQKTFSYYAPYNLKLADKISDLCYIKEKGMVRILRIEGLIYEILSMHIQQHDRETKNKKNETALLQRELEMIQTLSRRIVQNPSKPYALESLAQESGISQAKLQEGFKLLYNKTVNEYIRHIRLEAARDYISNSDMNISEIVYSIGFNSRSYFSKIFRDKYGISPANFKKNQVKIIEKSFS